MNLSTSRSLAAADAVAIRCLRDDLTSTQPKLLEQLRALSDPSCVNRWEGQGLLGLIAHRLRAAELLNELADPTRRMLVQIEDYYRDIAAVYLQNMAEILGKLTAEAIDVLVLKDPRGFPVPHARPGYDLDLLVRPEAMQRVTEVLLGQGFTEQSSPFREGMVDKVRGFDRYVGDLRVSLDVHWALLGGYLPRAKHIDVDELFADATVATIGGIPVPVLGLEHHLVNVGMHCYSHESRWPSRLITFCDASEAIRGAESVDWDRVISITRDWRAESDVHLTLAVAAKLLGSEVPDEVLTAIKPRLHRLGLDAAVYGYLNYTWRYVDKLTAAGSPRIEAAASIGRQALQNAHQLESRLVEFGGELAELADGTVFSFGTPSGALAISDRLPMYGDLYLVLEAVTVDQLTSQLPGLGFSHRDGCWRSTAAGYPITVQVGGPQLLSGMRRDLGVRWFLAKLAGLRPSAAELRVRLVAVPAGAIPALLLAQRAELDLVGLTELATRELAPGWPADAVQPRAAGVAELLGWPTGPNASGRSDWSLLAELDSRTSAIEALTKFVASPSGFRVAEAMAPYRLGVLGLAVALAKRRLRLVDLGYTARAVFDADRARRVPPRIYLSKGGDTVLDYQGLTPRTRRLGVLGRIRSLLTRAYS